MSSKEQSDLWDFHPSPSGKSIVAEYHTPEAYFQWIDMDSVVSRPITIPTASFSISDEDVAIHRNPDIKSKGVLSEVAIEGRDGPWRTICYVPPGQAGSCGDPEFISNEVLALSMPHEFSVVPKTGGHALLKVNFRDGEWLGVQFYPSADGKQLAVTVWEHKGGSAFLDTSSPSVLKRIVVYDIPKRQAVYTLDARQQKIKNVSGVALSPNGSAMAILTDGVVELYDLHSGH